MFTGCVLFDVSAEVEEMIDCQVYIKTQQNQMAAQQYM
jgi:hypothetical protein